MALPLGKLIAKDLILYQSASNSLYRFKNRERSLMSLFWTSYNNLEEGKNTLLVIDNKEDLENINYQISKNGLSNLCLILNDVKILESSYWIAKFRDDDQRKRALLSQVKEHDLASLALEELISEIKLNTNKLRVPQLGKMSLVRVNDKLAMSPADNIDTSAQILKPPYDYGVYRAKKDMFIEAEKIYKEKYTYLKQQDPFLRKSILDLGSEELQIKLSDASESIKALIKRYELVENEVISNFDQGNNGELDKIKKEVAVLRTMFHNDSDFTETEIIKQTYQQKLLFHALNISADPPTQAAELKMGLARIEEALAELIIAQFSETQHLSATYLNSLTSTNSDQPEVAGLISDTNYLFQDVRGLGIFKDNLDHRSVAFSYQKENLKKLQNNIAYAQYFLRDNSEYIEWLEFEEKLSEEDLTIISYLSNQDQFWGEGFEKLFLEYYVSHSKSTLGSVQKQSKQLDQLLSAYIKIRHVGLVQENFTYEGSHLDINSDSWESFLDECSAQITERYPLLIVDSEFYNKYCDRLVNAVDNILFLNNIPNKILHEEWLTNTFLGYEPAFLELSKKVKMGQSEVTTKSYNVNRHFKNLSIAELNRAARYLGQEMKATTSKFKLYQTRAVSIVSFWSDSKNALLLSHLEEFGVKEIVSDSSDFNLIPGILADTTTQNYVLLEDNLFSVEDQSSFVRQHLLLEELKTVGINVLSIDNYESIMKGGIVSTKILHELRTVCKSRQPEMV